MVIEIEKKNIQNISTTKRGSELFLIMRKTNNETNPMVTTIHMRQKSTDLKLLLIVFTVLSV